ncbi:MAG: ABC transporter permease [Theionarchaea archaeon]|nr:ABC transporter permease [Theionarchaea archaeon]
MDMLEIVVNNIMRRKARTFLTLLGISLGVAAVVALVSLSVGLKSNALDMMGKVTGDITVMQEGQMFNMSTLSEDTMRKVESISGVSMVAPTVMLMDLSRGFNVAGTEARGVDPDREERFSSNSWDIIDGRPLRSNDTYNAMAGTVLADQLGLEVGDTIMFMGEEFKIVGIITFGNTLLDQAYYIHIDTAREIAQRPSDYVNMIRVKVSKPGTEDEVAKRISLTIPGVEARSSEVMSEQVGDFLSIIEKVTWAISAVAAIVGGVGIANTMLMSVIERTKEIGVFKAVGWSNADVMKTILLEGLILGFLGGVMGVGLGFVATIVVKDQIPGFAGEITLLLIAEAMTFAMSLGVIGGIYPAYRAAHLDPVIALKAE